MTENTARYDAAAAALRRLGAELVRYAYAFMLNTADAQDAVQEAFMVYMKRAPEFADAQAEKAWLLKVTANKCKSMLRSSWFKTRAPIDEDLPADEESREIIRALANLPLKYRRVIHLHYYEGYSIEEIARGLDTKPATVGTWLKRGRELMRTELGGTDE